MFAQWQGKASGFTKGRGRSFHFGTQDYKIVGMISHLGPQLGVADSIRKNPHPVLVEFKTFRMHGHEEASGTKYVPTDLFDFWAKKDPVENYQFYLKENGLLTEEMEVAMKGKIVHEISENLHISFSEERIIPNETTELNDAYKLFEYQEVNENEEKKKCILLMPFLKV